MPEGMEAQPSSNVIPGTEDPSVQGQQGDTEGGEDPGTQGAAGAAPAQTWNPQEYAMSYRGQTVMPRDRQHLINLAQQGWGYTKSMEQLNREKQEMESKRGQYQKYDALEEALKTNPQLAESIWGMVQKQYSGSGGETDPAQNQLPPEVMQKLNEFDQFKQDFASSKADESLSKEIQQLRSSNPNNNWDVDDGNGTLQQRVLQHALDNNILDLRVAYRDMMWDTQAATVKAEALLQAKQARQAQKKAGVVDGGIPTNGASKKESGGYKAGDSYQALQDKVLSKY